MIGFSGESLQIGQCRTASLKHQYIANEGWFSGPAKGRDNILLSMRNAGHGKRP